MNINTNTLVSISEANQNFSRVARLVDENGVVVILKNNVPRYLIVEFGQAELEQIASDEDVMPVSRRLIQKICKPMRCLQNEKTDQTASAHAAYRAGQGNRRHGRHSG